MKPNQTAALSNSTTTAAHQESVASAIGAADVGARHPIFGILWYATNTLLVLSILSVIYCSVWEYSTRRYLKGFSDAVTPESSSPQEKIESILGWMAYGPKRQNALLATTSPDRDPTDTLNYAALLKVCGTATNAFINLADSGGLSARRLLLLDSRQMTKHVVAEVLIDGRWVVVDPAFRHILRDTNGALVTREQLADPVILKAAIKDMPNYDPAYTYDRTAHIRIARLRALATPLISILNKIAPTWEDSPELSLILERESLAAAIAAFAFVLAFALIRIGLRWYGEERLDIHPIRIRQQARRALHAFFDVTG